MEPGSLDAIAGMLEGDDGVTMPVIITGRDFEFSRTFSEEELSEFEVDLPIPGIVDDDVVSKLGHG